MADEFINRVRLGDATASAQDFEQRVQRNLGRVMFAARWIMAPVYIGLLASLVLIVAKFVQTLVKAIPSFLDLDHNATIYLVLSLVDLSLVGNLVVIVIFAGWENFVGRLLDARPGERPFWLSGLDFSTVKLKLIGSIAVVAAILILETFVHIETMTLQGTVLQLAVLLGIGVLGVLLAAMDRLGSHRET